VPELRQVGAGHQAACIREDIPTDNRRMRHA